MQSLYVAKIEKCRQKCCANCTVLTFLVDILQGPVRQEAGPRQGEPIVCQTKLPDALQILIPQLVTITAHIGALVLEYSAWLLTKCVPDTGSLAVGLPATSTKKDVSYHKVTQHVDSRKVQRHCY